MPSQREIRRRIASVRNIKQITRAMQFVAASKLKRAQDATLQARPYADEDRRGPGGSRRRARRRGAPAAGQARGRHARARAADQRSRPGRLAEHQHDQFAARSRSPRPRPRLRVVTVGRKGHAAMRRARVPIAATFEGFGERPDFRVDRAAGATVDRRLPGRHIRRDRPGLPALRFDARPATGDRPPAAGRAEPIRPPRASPGASSSSSPIPTPCSASCCRATWRRASTRPRSSSPRASTRPRWWR